jgi:hypothetical protein
MVTELSSKFKALLAREKYRLDGALYKTIREGRANLVLQGGYSSTANAFLQKQEYETDIEKRLATLLTTLSRLLASSSVREIHDNRPELDQLAKAWLQEHIDDCQARLNGLAEKNGAISLDQLNLGRERLLDALTAELAILSATAPSVLFSSEAFVDPVRIEELSSLSPSEFDVSRLVRLCEELNLCFRHRCFHAVAFITRAILDHIPPVFGFKNFGEVASQYNGGRSFKRATSHLEDVSRKICDLLLHMPIRKSEVLPTLVQVDVHQELETVLAEVVRIARQA